MCSSCNNSSVICDQEAMTLFYQQMAVKTKKTKRTGENYKEEDIQFRSIFRRKGFVFPITCIKIKHYVT